MTTCEPCYDDGYDDGYVAGLDEGRRESDARVEAARRAGYDQGRLDAQVQCAQRDLNAHTETPR